MRPLALLVLVLLPAALHAQGFRTFSGRNHPELDWRVARTEHFEIVYPERLAGIEAEAAAVAEASYEALSKNLGVTFDQPLRVYLSDEDEIANGVAFDVGPAGFTNIWVHVNETAEIWTGDVKWLRKVIAHELAHLFHYRAVRSPVGALQNLFANPTPSFFAEGLAQYQTEAWDAQRGDRWLRTAVFEDRLSYSDATSPWNGRLRYAVGNSQVRYLAEQYGDSTLANLLGHRQTFLPGVRVHDFYGAFKKAVGKTYRAFYEEWRQHVNVYYNTLAGQMERVDSLGSPLALPGQFLYDVAFSPDTSKAAVLVLTSVARPVQRLAVVAPWADSTRREVGVVAEGALQGPVAWSPEGERLAYARRVRGTYGSLVNDLYLYDFEEQETRRLTENRRAASPTFAPDGRRLAFIATEREAANVFVLDLGTGAERRLTTFAGDVQLTTLRWSPDGSRLAAARFGPRGERDLILIDAETGAAEPVSPSGPGTDDRVPVWSPDGRRLAFTSLRDDVPNVFVLDLGGGVLAAADSAGAPAPEERRVTYLFAGATAHDWLPPDSLHPDGRLVLVTSESKRRERAYAVDAGRRVAVEAPAVAPPAYSGWTTHRPPETVPYQIAPDPSLIRERTRYTSWANVTHAATLGLPYYDSPDDWGAFASTLWLEPLGKHLFVGLLSVSVPSPVEKTIGYLQYTNNQLRPSLSVSLYRYPSPARWYGSTVLVEDLAGGDLGASLPLDLTDRPFLRTSVDARLRLAYAEPFDQAEFDEIETTSPLRAPEAGYRTEVRLGFTATFQRPYRYNALYPLDGAGFRARVTGGVPVLEDAAYVRPDVQAYWTSPLLGIGRFFAYGRAQARFGDALAQDFLGLSRYDDVDLQLPMLDPVTLSDTERVRGYRSYAVGDRVLFGSLEYRLPPVFDLQTRLLGFLEFGRVSPALFVDAGVVWTGSDLGGAVRRTGVGGEVKNLVSLGGFELVHALGVAQRWDLLGESVEGDDVDLYYRVQAVLPF